MRVLDAGCGTGDDVRALSAIVGDGGKVRGIDASAALIGEAIKRGVPGNAAFQVARAEALPYDDETFDAVRAERVLQHTADPQMAAHEFYRVLRPGGTVFALDQDWETLAIAGAPEETTSRIKAAFVRSVPHPRTGRELRGLLRRAGFASVTLAPSVAMPALPIAFELIARPAVDAALAAGELSPAQAKDWLAALLEAEAGGSFYCGVVVVAALATRPGP